LLRVRRQFDDFFVSARRKYACGKEEEKEFVKDMHTNNIKNLFFHKAGRDFELDDLI
jgi:hypothetical protein